MNESPYVVPGSEETIDASAKNAEQLAAAGKRMRPDGTIEPESEVDPKVMVQFLEKVGAISEKIAEHGVSELREMDTSTGMVTSSPLGVNAQDGENKEPPKKWSPPETPDAIQRLFNKVATFLDPRTKGPRTMLTVRHKVFIVKLPTAHEMLDAGQIVGVKVGDIMTEAEAAYYHIQVLKKAIEGWLPESSAQLAFIRENLHDKSLWPALNTPDWLSTRDPYWYTDEVGPLYLAFMQWRTIVEPTPEEFDFYFSRMT